MTTTTQGTRGNDSIVFTIRDGRLLDVRRTVDVFDLEARVAQLEAENDALRQQVAALKSELTNSDNYLWLLSEIAEWKGTVNNDNT